MVEPEINLGDRHMNDNNYIFGWINFCGWHVTEKSKLCYAKNKCVHSLEMKFCMIVALLIFEFFFIITLDFPDSCVRHILNSVHRQTSDYGSTVNGIFYIVTCVFGGLALIIIPVAVRSDIIINHRTNTRDSDSRPLLNRKLGFSDWFRHWLGIWKTTWRANRIQKKIYSIV